MATRRREFRKDLKGISYVSELTWREGDYWVHSPGSNFYIEPDNTHVEGEFQAAKHRSALGRRAAAVRLTNMKPGFAKIEGRKMNLRPDWEKVKDDIMYKLVLRKFQEHDECWEWLDATGELLIVEGNIWHDNYWGNCRCGKPKCKKTGSNKLGQILMNVRHDLRRG